MSSTGIKGLMEKMRIDREIASLESKKKDLVKSVSNEISHLQAKITAKYTEIGESVYNGHIANDSSQDLLMQKFDEVTAMKNNIDEKQLKIKSIVDRYNEEKSIMEKMKTQTPVNTPPPPPPPQPDLGIKPRIPAAGTCGACGAPFSIDDVFCKNCGNKVNNH